MSESSKSEKQYGLIMKTKSQLSTPKSGNVFGDDSNSDVEEGVDWVKKALKGEGEKNRVKRQTQLTMQRALKENPTVYQYDEIYDEMERTKAEEKVIKKEDKKPKYMHNLLKTAERRKREQEHRMERMVQKEREAEGDMYADKESFVTSAYKAKLEEFKKMEEEEARMDRLEAIGNVMNQQDMSGFYRHLYHQTVDRMEKGKENENRLEKAETSNIDRDDSSTSDSASEKNADVTQNAEKTRAKIKKNRQYRKRVINESESDSDTMEKKLPDSKVETTEAPNLDKVEKNTKHNEPRNKKQKLSTENLKTGNENVEKEDCNDNSQDSEDTKSCAHKSPINEDKNVSIPKEKEEKKISIWKKRTVGPIYEAALQRYYVRKATRSSSL